MTIPPNLLVILADDQRADLLRYMPNVRNQLIARGTQFTACRCNTPFCQPSRVGLLTGQWANHHKVLNNSGSRTVPDSLNHGTDFDHDDTIASWLAATQPGPGYRCGLFGKYLNGAESALPESDGSSGLFPKPQGWATWRQLVSKSGGYGIHHPTNYWVSNGEVDPATGLPVPYQPGTFQTEWLRDEVTAFVAGPEPWFCLLTPTAGHDPMSPHPQDVFAWSHVQWPLVLEDDVSLKPSWVRNRPSHDAESAAAIRGFARGQLGELTAVDRLVGDVLTALPDGGSNTVVIYASDNGMSYGEHRAFLSRKNEPYDTSMLVPLVARGPGFPASTCEEPVSMAADVTATCLAVAGATPGRSPQDGLDLRTVANDPASYADRALLHSRGHFPTIGSPRGDGITTKTRKLWRWETPDPLDQFELYDLDTDAVEWINVANDGQRLGDRQALANQLDDFLVNGWDGLPPP